MAMLGMQADTQCSYFPAYYSSTDLNLNASCSTWPLNNVDKTLSNAHYLNCSLTQPFPDQHLAYKEILKQKMLQHEAVFKDQIRELHRLYNRQRELMDEIKKSKLYRYHPWSKNLQSNPILLQDSFEHPQKTCQVSSLPWLDGACSQSPISGSGISLLHSSYDEEKSTHAGCDLASSEGYVNEPELLESKCKKVGNKILDLELPANEYIDSEEDESFSGVRVHQVLEMPSYLPKRISVDVQKSDVEPTIGNSDRNLVFQEDNMPQPLLSRKTKGLADLNEPIKLEEETDPESSDFLGLIPHNGKIPCHDMSMKTNLDLQVRPNEIIQNTQTEGDAEASSNIIGQDKNDSQLQLLSETDETRQNSSDLNSFPEGICAETLSLSSEDTKVEPVEQTTRNFQIKRENFGLESFQGTINSYPGHVADGCQHTSNQLVPLADYESSLVSSSRKHTRDFARTPIAVQALPCFNNYVKWGKSSKNRSSGIAKGNSPHSKNLKYNPKIHGASAQSSFCYSEDESASEDNVHEGSEGVNSSRDIDLNCMSPSCSSDAADQSIWISDGEKKSEDSTGGSPQFIEKPVNVGKSNKRCKNSTTKFESVIVQANTSTLDIESKTAEACDRQGTKRLQGMLVYDTLCKTIDQCPSHAFPPKTLENSSEDNGDNCVNLDCNFVPNSGEQLNANQLAKNRQDKQFSFCGFHIDLNSCINEDVSSLPPSLSIEIDSDAPASPQNKETPPSRGESNGNQLEASFQLSRTRIGNLLEEVVMTAAEAIISISSSQVQSCTMSTPIESSAASKVDSLYWFARIVSSVVDDPESKFGVVLSCEFPSPPAKHHSDGIDYFEAMTLQLKETKLEEYFSKTYSHREEAARLASFPSQPRRGRTRKARHQQKDFQNEILPSLASLSRYEVTEDLQAIGGLIETAHTRWNTGARKTSRNGSTRGRRRKRHSVSTSNAETAVSVQLKRQSRHGELCVEERSLIDWGTITRRPRGQRCPASNCWQV